MYWNLANISTDCPVLQLRFEPKTSDKRGVPTNTPLCSGDGI